MTNHFGIGELPSGEAMLVGLVVCAGIFILIAGLRQLLGKNKRR